MGICGDICNAADSGMADGPYKPDRPAKIVPKKPERIVRDTPTGRVVRAAEKLIDDKLAYVKDIVASGEAFTDKEFAPELSSFYANSDSLQYRKKQMYQNLEWKRVSQIFQSPKMFA